MPDSVVPDPEFQPRDDLTARRIERDAAESTGRAEREASALLAEAQPYSPAMVHDIVATAWARGFLAGYERCVSHMNQAFELIAEATKR